MKKGFTLVELLAVIVILAVILVIAIPQVLKVVENSRISAYIKNEQMVLKAVDLYVSRNTGELPGEIGSTTEVSLNYLVTNGMLTEITNPYNKNEDCTGYVTITKLSDIEYNYTPHLRCGLDIHDSADDGLVAHYKFDNFQESTENYMSVVSWQPWFEELQIGDSSDRSVGEGVIRVTRVGEYKYRATIIEDTFYPRLSLTSSFSWPADIPCTISANITAYYEAPGTEGRFGLGRSSHGGPRLNGNDSLGKKEYLYLTDVDRNGTISVRASNLLITAGTYIEWEFLQVEFGKTYSTPFVDGIREGIVKDFSVNNNHGKTIGNPVPSVDRFGVEGRVIKFDGSNDYIEIPNYNLSDNATISVWVNTPRNTVSQIIVGDHNSISLGIHNHDNLIGFSSSSRPSGYLDNCFNNNEWNHLAVVVENGQMKYYCNGLQLSFTSNNNWGLSSSDFAYIGRRTPEREMSPFYYEGYLDNLRIYSRSLSDIEIMQLYNSNH